MIDGAALLNARALSRTRHLNPAIVFINSAVPVIEAPALFHVDKGVPLKTLVVGFLTPAVAVCESRWALPWPSVPWRRRVVVAARGVVSVEL